jgi:hypothetical protein
MIVGLVLPGFASKPCLPKPSRNGRRRQSRAALGKRESRLEPKRAGARVGWSALRAAASAHEEQRDEQCRSNDQKHDVEHCDPFRQRKRLPTYVYRRELAVVLRRRASEPLTYR